MDLIIVTKIILFTSWFIMGYNAVMNGIKAKYTIGEIASSLLLLTFLFIVTGNVAIVILEWLSK